MTQNITTILTSCILAEVENKNGEQIKTFYESLGFDGIYTTDDSYFDYFKSEEYLHTWIDRKIEEDKKLFINNLKKATKESGVWGGFEDLIYPKNVNDIETKIRVHFESTDYFMDNYADRFTEYGEICKLKVEEIKNCYRTGAYISAIVNAGSLIETLTHEICGDPTKFQVNFNAQKAVLYSNRNNTGNPIIDYIKKKDNSVLGKFSPNNSQWTFQKLNVMAFYTSIFTEETFDNVEKLREYRNKVHPYLQGTFRPCEEDCLPFIDKLNTGLKDIRLFIDKNGI